MLLRRIALLAAVLLVAACTGLALDARADRAARGRASPMSAPAAAVPRLPRTAPVVVVAHNAGDHLAVERRDLAAGADVVEIDVRSAGDELIAAHDPTLPGLEDLLFRGPSLAQAWRLAARRPTVLLHLKESSPAYLQQVRAFVRSQPRRRVIVQTFDPGTLAWVRRHMPAAQRLLLVSTPAQLRALQADPSGLDGVSLRDGVATAPVLAWARAHGLRTFVWSVDDARRASVLAAQGVDGIITDAPAAIAAR
jgi:glycerophosphoryl diester phosphodiesterase